MVSIMKTWKVEMNHYVWVPFIGSLRVFYYFFCVCVCGTVVCCRMNTILGKYECWRFFLWLICQTCQNCLITCICQVHSVLEMTVPLAYALKQTGATINFPLSMEAVIFFLLHIYLLLFSFRYYEIAWFYFYSGGITQVFFIALLN